VQTALITDSTAYLSTEQAAALQVRVVSLSVSLGDLTAAEVDVDPADWWRLLRAAGETRPKTSQPPPGAFVDAFTHAADGGATRVLCLTCGAGLSGTHGSALLAAGMSPIPVDVVDTGTISGGLLLVVGIAARSLLAGVEPDEVLARVRSLRGAVWSTWASDSTRLLELGGRSRGPVPEGDGVPVLGLEGEIRTLGLARTAEESIALQAERVRAALKVRPGRISVGHGGAPAFADALAEELTGAPGLMGIDTYAVGPAVSAHVGPGSYGVNYLAPTGAPS